VGQLYLWINYDDDGGDGGGNDEDDRDFVDMGTTFLKRCLMCRVA
jgi:hypothetical protein